LAAIVAALHLLEVVEVLDDLVEGQLVQDGRRDAVEREGGLQPG
jgi:hypothetical protein